MRDRRQVLPFIRLECHLTTSLLDPASSLRERIFVKRTTGGRHLPDPIPQGGVPVKSAAGGKFCPSSYYTLRAHFSLTQFQESEYLSSGRPHASPSFHPTDLSVITSPQRVAKRKCDTRIKDLASECDDEDADGEAGVSRQCSSLVD